MFSSYLSGTKCLPGEVLRESGCQPSKKDEQGVDGYTSGGYYYEQLIGEISEKGEPS